MSTYMRSKNVHLAAMDPEKYAREYAHWLNEGTATEHLFTGFKPLTPQDIAEEWEKNRESGDIEFSIIHQSSFIGTCGLYSIKTLIGCAELRILIVKPSCFGKGLGKECVTLLVDYGFKRLRLNRIWLGVSESNERAWKCYESVGFQLEGKHRQAIWARGKYHDSRTYGILAQDWSGTA